MDYQLTKGRPCNCEARLASEVRCYDFLDRCGVHYEYNDHEAFFTMEDAKAEDQILNASICKNLFLQNHSKSMLFLLLIPGDKRFDSKVVSKLVGVSRLSFANEVRMKECLNLTPGSVSVLGLLNDTENKVKLLIDRDVMRGEYFACHPCINTTSLRFPMEEFSEKVLPALGHEPVFLDIPW